jgi:hypothetical protein
MNAKPANRGRPAYAKASARQGRVLTQTFGVVVDAGNVLRFALGRKFGDSVRPFFADYL